MNHLERLARRASDDPQFLGFALRLYAESERLDDGALAVRFACLPESLSMLRLCRVPDSDPIAFLRDIEQIAARFGASASVLVDAVRRAQVLVRLRTAAVEERGTMLAARDDGLSETDP